MATPEAQAAQAELVAETKARLAEAEAYGDTVPVDDFYKLHRVRVSPALAKAERRADRRAMAATLARGEPPF